MPLLNCSLYFFRKKLAKSRIKSGYDFYPIDLKEHPVILWILFVGMENHRRLPLLHTQQQWLLASLFDLGRKLQGRLDCRVFYQQEKLARICCLFHLTLHLAIRRYNTILLRAALRLGTAELQASIQAGEGLAVLDPHGDLVKRVLRYVPEGRRENLIYFDPTDERHAIPFNILKDSYAQRYLIVSGILGAFKKIFRNIGTLIAFQVGTEDAEYLAREFAPTFAEEDLINLPRYHIYLKLMVDGRSSQPFSAVTLPPSDNRHTSYLTSRATQW